jgi:tRNA modification GTPase
MNPPAPSVSQPIAAIATAAGRGGIGVVRISGSGLSPLIEVLLGAAQAARIAPRVARYVSFLDADGEAIDQGLALWFPAPHSYTGEEVLELQGHGGPVVMQLLLERVLQAGAPLGLRLAEPGEFTQRAFLNDKLDLAQAEAVADLIDASTGQAARSAARSLAGAFSREVHGLLEPMIDLRMLVEATLDFPEEEIDFLQRADAIGRLSRLQAMLAALLARARQGALLRDGLDVVLAGEPNVGKSSLLNALAGAEVAIVTPVAGTTRDRVREAISVRGVPLNIVDTAGLRETDDEVERIGIARTWEAVAQADVVLHLVAAGADGCVSNDVLAAAIAGRLPAGVPVLRVVNKVDLAGMPARLERDIAGRPVAVWLSAREGQGLELLREALLELGGWQSAGESVFIARERHLAALRAAQAHLDRAAERAGQGDRQLDLLAEELRLAQERLGEITGEFSADDLLGVIFSRFCIGK